jgi:hypothetical protein
MAGTGTKQTRSAHLAATDTLLADNTTQLISEADLRDRFDDTNASTAFLTGTNSFTGQQRWFKGADIASASNLLLIEDGNVFDVTGTTNIDTLADLGGTGAIVILRFTAVLTINNSAANLILPSGANIITAAGDHGIFVNYASGDWRCISYEKIDGRALIDGGGGSGTITGSGTDNYIPRINGTTAIENSIIYDDGTNIGVNDSAPQALLHLTKTSAGAKAVQLLLQNSSNTTATETAILFVNRIDAELTAFYRRGELAMSTDGSGKQNFHVRLGDGASLAEMFTVLGATGYVGLNETSPDAQLDLNGTIKLTEQTAKATVTIAKGQIWVKDTAPNTLWFTDDDDVDFQLNTTGSVGEVKTTGFTPTYVKTSGTVIQTSDDITHLKTGNLFSMQGRTVFGASTSTDVVNINNIPENVDGFAGTPIGNWQSPGSGKYGFVTVGANNGTSLSFQEYTGAYITYDAVASAGFMFSVTFHL